ncbi:hypothetical protein, partial [Massilia cavernae]|uniref:hypothetical protein n=1 Tax=Massilia cavernae TaxID=2320864 RepID=UPI001C7217A1
KKACGFAARTPKPGLATNRSRLFAKQITPKKTATATSAKLQIFQRYRFLKTKNRRYAPVRLCISHCISTG